MTQRLTTVGDRVVIIVGVLFVMLLYGLYWQPSAAGSRVEYSSPDTHDTLPLDEDRTLTLKGPLGASHVEIRNGRVRFQDSPCRNQYCVHSGWLDQTGDFAACVPNRISLLVQTERQPIYDAVNY